MMMRNCIVLVFLLFCSLTGRAQEKVMNVQKVDGTTIQTRVAELKEISFLAVEKDGQGLLVKSMGGETTAVRFEANPVVAVSNGRLTVTSDSEDAVEFEITDIAEIRFGDAKGMAVEGVEAFSWVVQEGGVVLRGLPEGAVPRVYSADGRCLPVPPAEGGELRLSRETLGTGVFIVKVGTSAAKIKL